MANRGHTVQGANYYGGHDFDWNAYHAYRPVYPAKIYDLIFDYHGRKVAGAEPQWDLAADFGSGPGTIVPALLSRFKNVVASDLNEVQIEVGRRTLIPKFGSDRIEIRVAEAERCDWLPDGSVDLVTAAEAVHWFQADEWVEQVARTLKPGGTIAFWFYAPCFTVINPCDPKLVELFTKLNVMLIEDFSCKPSFPNSARVAVYGLLEHIGLSASRFEQEQRHYWYLPDGPAGKIGLGDETKLKSYALSGKWPNRIGSSAEVIHRLPEPGTGSCGDDGIGHILERGPWTLDDLNSYLETLGFDFSSLRATKEYQEVWQDIKQIVGGDQGVFYVAFALVAVMAKRS